MHAFVKMSMVIKKSNQSAWNESVQNCHDTLSEPYTFVYYLIYDAGQTDNHRVLLNKTLYFKTHTGDPKVNGI